MFNYSSDAEFQATNIHRLYEGFASLLAEQENDIVAMIKVFFSWITTTQQQIGFAESGTYSGIKRAFLEYFRNMGQYKLA